jgi:predicted DCC family thiol-disulfide oxidoreductase YuxK
MEAVLFLSAPEEAQRPAQGLLIWFDGSCPLCRREIALMKRLDRRGAITFVNIAGTAPGECPVDRAQLLSRFHAREEGRLVSGAEAFAAMWRAIPVLRPLGLLARVPLVLAVLERCYTAFLRFRPRLQRLMRSVERT